MINCEARIRSNIIGFKTAVKNIQTVNIAASQICSDAPFTSVDIIEEITRYATGDFKSWREGMYSHHIEKRGWGAALGIVGIVAGIAGISISGSLSNSMNNENLEKIQSEVEVIDDLIEDVAGEIIKTNENQIEALDAEAKLSEQAQIAYASNEYGKNLARIVTDRLGEHESISSTITLNKFISPSIKKLIEKIYPNATKQEKMVMELNVKQNTEVITTIINEDNEKLAKKLN